MVGLAPRQEDPVSELPSGLVNRPVVLAATAPNLDPRDFEVRRDRSIAIVPVPVIGIVVGAMTRRLVDGDLESLVVRKQVPDVSPRVGLRGGA